MKPHFSACQIRLIICKGKIIYQNIENFTFIVCCELMSSRTIQLFLYV